MLESLLNWRKKTLNLYEKKNLIGNNEVHYVNKKVLKGPFNENLDCVTFGMGCFWGVERIFWNINGVEMTAVGYAGGSTQNPTYREVCSGTTGHNEVVKIHFDKNIVSFETILRFFWEGHDPTQGMRQGNDIGTQYRSSIYTHSDQHFESAIRARDSYQNKLNQAGYGKITTEIMSLVPFFYAESYHQQYLAKNPNGYCGIGGTDVKF